MKIRDASADDFPHVLELNEAFVQFLSPLTPERLALLHGQAACHRVVDIDGTVAAFLIAFREGSTYDSPNYGWFGHRYPQFLYIDRVVVGDRHQGMGIGRQLYADVLAFARATGASRVTCEFDIDPPNEQSRRFHEKLGFSEVGTQVYGPANKRVSLQAIPVGVEK